MEPEGVVSADVIEKAREGVVLKDGSVCKSAVIERLGVGRSTICIREGMYHQVRRMYAALGLHVTYLRRIRIGALTLGDLKPSETRELTEDEIELLFSQA